ncbi:MAG: glycosyltransferase family 4 protein [Verrucomicrobiota bacterium]
MKILVWTDSNALAGTERHCLELGAGLQDAGVSVRVGCRPKSPMTRVLEQQGVEIVLLDAEDAPFRAFRTIRGLLRKGDLDLIHAHNGRATMLACLAVRSAGCGCVVATQHFISPARASRRGLRRLASDLVHGWVNGQVTGWVAISRAVADQIAARGDAPPSCVSIVPNGTGWPNAGEPGRIAARDKLGLPQSTLVLLCVARLASEKGLEVLLNGCAMLMQEGLSFRLVFVGDGVLQRSLQRLAGLLGLSGCVRWVGYQPEPGEWMRAADLLILPSTEEPFGLVLIEAMSRGIPVLAAAAGGPVEIVDASCGMLFQPGDARDLASKAWQILRHPVLMKRLGEGGLVRWVKSYQAGIMVARMIEVYGRVLSSASGRSAPKTEAGQGGGGLAVAAKGNE